MNRSTIFIIVVLAGSLTAGVLASLHGQDSASSQANMQQESDKSAMASNEVTIDNFSFTPQTLTIPAGATVKWTNKDDVPHTVVETNRKFKSKALDTDETFSFTFTDPGTYEYFCSVHPKMVAKVIVEQKQ
jgi:plastocyanin